MQLQTLKPAQLLSLYNSVADKPVAKFASRAIAEKKLAVLMGEKGLMLIDNGGEPTLAEKATDKPGDDAKITVLVNGNPKRFGTPSYKRFALYKEGMTVSAFKAAGGTTADIRWDQAHNFIKVG